MQMWSWQYFLCDYKPFRCWQCAARIPYINSHARKPIEKSTREIHVTNLVPTARRSFGANLHNTFETFDKDFTFAKLLKAMRPRWAPSKVLVLRVRETGMAAENVFFGRFLRLDFFHYSQKCYISVCIPKRVQCVREIISIYQNFSSLSVVLHLWLGSTFFWRALSNRMLFAAKYGISGRFK